MNRIAKLFLPPKPYWKFQASDDWYRKIGISKKRFSKIMQNDDLATKEELSKIANELGLNITDLVKEDA
jgi:hypothetical protein